MAENSEKRRFCRLLDKAVTEEEQAHDEYYELHTAAYEAGLGYPVADEIELIMSDEMTHSDRLKDLFNQHCET